MQTEFPFRVIARFNGLPQILAVKIGITSGQNVGFVPDQGSNAVCRLPVETHETALAVLVDHPVRVDAEPLNHAQAAGNAPVGHGPHDIVQRLRLERNIVPEGVMRALPLRHFILRFRLHRVNKIGKLDGVLNEEDRRIVANEVEVAFLSIELCGKAADVPHGVG